MLCKKFTFVESTKQNHMRGIRQFSCLSVVVLLILGALGCQPQENSTSSSSNNSGGNLVRKVLNLYTFRYEEKDRQIIDVFQNRHKIEVNVTHLSSQEQMDKLLSDPNAQVDLLWMDDLGLLGQAKDAGKLQPFSSVAVDNNVAGRYRDVDGYWIGMTKSAVAFAVKKGGPEYRSSRTYNDIIRKDLKGKVAVTQLNSRATRGLLAGMIKQEGQQTAEAWAKGVVQNLVEAPLASPDSVASYVASGKAAVGIVDAGAFLRFMYSGSPEAFAIAEQIELVYPTTTQGNALVNLTFLSMPNQVINRREAIQFAEFLSSKTGQEALSATLFEFSLNPTVIPSDLVINMGGFKESPENLEYLNALNEQAVAVGQAAGWK